MSDSVGYSVDYGLVDPFKVRAQEVARSTDGNIRRLGLEVVRESRGESVFLIKAFDGFSPTFVGGVPETLGTKNLVADAMRSITGRTYYDAVAQDTVAMNVNDLITLGVVPVVVGAHIAAGSSAWFADGERSEDLIQGWKIGCDIARCVYGPGESPSLGGIVCADTALLSGFAIGVIQSNLRPIQRNISPGDAVVGFTSSGIHANGLTDARAVAAKNTAGYADVISDGRLFGDALLDPTTIYAPVVEDCILRGLEIHYAVNITGHGWLKLMRASEPFTYVIDKLPPVPAVIQYVTDRLDLTPSVAYSTFNMGMGFALYVPENDVVNVIRVAAEHAVQAWPIGYVEESPEKRVVLRPLQVEYGSDELNLR